MDTPTPRPPGVTLGLAMSAGGACAPLFGWLADQFGLNRAMGVLLVVLGTRQRRWCLVGRDPQSAVWGVFRVDQLTLRMATHRRFTPQPLPGADYASFVMRQVSSAGWAVHARITVFASAEEVLSRIHSAVGVVEAIDDKHCVLMTGADSASTVAVYIGMLGLDFRVTDPPELVAELVAVAERYFRAVAR